MIDVMNQIMTGEATPLQVAAILTALRMKGETVDEITGAARVMREKAHRVNVGTKTVLDTCGTGGDQKGTFNISTTSAFVLAGAVVARMGDAELGADREGDTILEECLEWRGGFHRVRQRPAGYRSTTRSLTWTCAPAAAFWTSTTENLSFTSTTRPAATSSSSSPSISPVMGWTMAILSRLTLTLVPTLTPSAAARSMMTRDVSTNTT